MVDLHRAVRFARENASARVLLTTYNGILADALQRKLDRLAGPDFVRTGRVTIRDLQGIALELHAKLLGPVRLATGEEVSNVLASAAAGSDLDVDLRFLRDEWSLIVDLRNVRDAATYRDLPRHGRKTRLTGDRREALWTIFAAARDELADRQLKTYAEVLHETADALEMRPDKPFDHVAVDEAQDISVAELRFLKAACRCQQNGLFFAGDIGQRIFRPAFSWAAEGVEIRGRSRSLKVNYRTSHQ